MPPRTPKACRVRGCRHTTTDPSGYCESHKSEGWKQYKPGQSRHQRGGTDADSNLQSLCWPCHKAKTARERLK
ncbi:HNH endonuclease [Escherichia coli]|uniref:HNH endonuclease n=1 Tax=Escherichia coli TaxID=562 RepID=UPI001F4B8CDF|nr:HNH endonuclease [Escherichia coli]